VAQYFTPGSLRKQEMLTKATVVDFLIVKNEGEALYLESNLIKKHKPFYNTMLKGGNGYTYIKLTSHQFPQIFLTRMKKNDKATYI
jgi:excinuclease ABC subunit C